MLLKHPKLRINVMHAGYPMLDDTLALLYAHPQVYVDTGVIVYTLTRPDGSEVIAGERVGAALDGAAMGLDLANELRARAPADFFDWG